MKKIFLILFFITNISLLSGQTPDLGASYVLREVHIYTADEYLRAVTENQVKYTTYITNLITTFVAPRSNVPLIPPATDQTIQIQANRSRCMLYLSPNKIIRCQDKLNVLTAAAIASNAILLSPSVYPINNALRVKLEMEAIAIQNLINEYLYK